MLFRSGRGQAGDALDDRPVVAVERAADLDLVVVRADFGGEDDRISPRAIGERKVDITRGSHEVWRELEGCPEETSHP